MTNKYRVHHWTEYDYSEIKEYVDEWHTDKPLRNDELVEILNSQDKRINELEAELEDYKTLQFRKTIKWRGY